GEVGTRQVGRVQRVRSGPVPAAARRTGQGPGLLRPRGPLVSGKPGPAVRRTATGVESLPCRGGGLAESATARAMSPSARGVSPRAAGLNGTIKPEGAWQLVVATPLPTHVGATGFEPATS